MAKSLKITDREMTMSDVFGALGDAPLTLEQAKRAAQLLGVHHSTVYRLRKRFRSSRRTSDLIPISPGPKAGRPRINPSIDDIIDDVLRRWLPRQTFLAHPLLDMTMEVRKRCDRADLPGPSRFTVKRRWTSFLEEQAAKLATDPASKKPPGKFEVSRPLDVVQIDHTQADVFVVDPWFRQTMGRPWLSVAIDVATRCIVAIYVAMERPSSATVALLISRIVLAKEPWLSSLGVDCKWPMHGLPAVLHFDNAGEFKSRALQLGCAEYGIKLMHRPPGRPQYGGHIERMNRTLMQRLKGLPGATGNSVKGRKASQPEAKAVLTLAEFERWLILEVAQRYHNSPHRGLHDATPLSAWNAMAEATPPRQLRGGPDEELQLLIQFMPLTMRTVQADGLSIFRITYWHPVFTAWRARKRKVMVRYHPEDLSRIYVSIDGKKYLEAVYADIRKPAISLWEQRAALKILRSRGASKRLSERLIFQAIEEQRSIVAKARIQTQQVKKQTKSIKRPSVPQPWDPVPAAPAPVIDYSKPAPAYDVEIW